MEDKLMQNRNRFGLLAKDYAKHRRGYPDEVYTVIQEHLPKGAVDALDVGCGTGVVTCELAKFCHSVIGTDKEAEMIEVAQASAPDNCSFKTAPAESLPFPDNSFNLITVAQAFHWFDHGKVIAEFQRLIRPNGLIAIFRKRSKDGNKILADFVWPVLGRYVDQPNLPRNQNDFSKLKDAGFVSCEVINVPYEELYTPDEYIGFLRSHSVYNLIPQDQRETYEQDMRVEMAKHLENGYVAIRGIVEMWLLCS
jgi:ubiquinone/menaquinone biosynthesis C-methylase UbiE